MAFHGTKKTIRCKRNRQISAFQADDIHRTAKFALLYDLSSNFLQCVILKRDQYDLHRNDRCIEAVKFLYACKDRRAQHHNALIRRSAKKPVSPYTPDGKPCKIRNYTHRSGAAAVFS